MTRYDSNWAPFASGDAIRLAAVLFLIAGGLVYLGARVNEPIEAGRPGKIKGIFLSLIWLLSLASFVVAVATYIQAFTRQRGTFSSPANPITPVTVISGLVTFMVIFILAKQYRFGTAFGSAVVGTIAAPMIFELPFDLIVMSRTFPPDPAALFTLLFFLPLFLVEVSSFALLTLSPLTRISKYTLYSLAGMFFVFAIWALFGFSYPSHPLPIALNMTSKVLSFITAATLFLPAG